MKRVLITLAAFVLTILPANAQVPMTGTFVAEATCAAPSAIREGGPNPGNVTVAAGQSYQLLGRNSVPGSHYLILVPGAEPERRWVPYGCGRVGSQPDSTQEARRAVPDIDASQPEVEEFVLAANWHASFCETRPDMRECSGGDSPLSFALHGLWPQQAGQYCNVPDRVRSADEAGRWSRLPAVELSRSAARNLAHVMPGVESGLDRHQWVKHGSCSGLQPDVYFNSAARLINQLNESLVGELFVRNVGNTLSSRQIRRAFDDAFGRGAGDRVLVDCVTVDDRRLIRELRISLAGQISQDQPLARLIASAPQQAWGCREGEVDAPGQARIR
ncbi:ribonuclease T2 family protein [Aureimonas fodinaquatilis]|nr:ribonuclease [Aureimonas fodinaquatilis]